MLHWTFRMNIKNENALLLTGNKVDGDFLSCWWISLSSGFAQRANFKAEKVVCSRPKWCYSMDQAFRELQEASSEALCSLHVKMTLQSMPEQGLTDSANVTENQFPRFPLVSLRFSQTFQVFLIPGFALAGPKATADRLRVSHIDAQRRAW